MAKEILKFPGMMVVYCPNVPMNYYREKHLATGMEEFYSSAQRENY